MIIYAYTYVQTNHMGYLKRTELFKIFKYTYQSRLIREDSTSMAAVRAAGGVLQGNNSCAWAIAYLIFNDTEAIEDTGSLSSEQKGNIILKRERE